MNTKGKKVEVIYSCEYNRQIYLYMIERYRNETKRKEKKKLDDGIDMKKKF